MKKFKILLFLVICLAVAGVTNIRGAESGNVYYVSPEASGTGTSEADAGDFRTIMLQLRAGDTVHVAAGTYKLLEKLELNNSGNAHNYIKVVGPSEGSAVIDFSAMTFDSTNRGISIKGNYWHFNGIEVTKAGDNGMYISGSFNLIENCLFYENRDSGLQIGRAQSSDTDINIWPHNNYIKNCTSYANYDDETFGENADGFAAKLTVGYGNVFDSCIAYNNSDDGWDLYAKVDSGNIGTVFLYNCVSFRNGFLPDGTVTRDGDGIGFKLGGSTMVGDAMLVNCVAFNNRLHGFSDNSNPGVLSLINCTAFDNSVGSTKLAGEVNGTINADMSGDGSNSNFDLARTESSYNNFYGLLSFASKGNDVAADKFVGPMAYSVVYAGKDKYNLVTDYIESSSYNANKSGTVYGGLSADDFKSLTLPNDLDIETVHQTFRNEDGSVNLGDLLALKDSANPSSLINGYFTTFGQVIQKVSNGAVTALEIGKAASSGISFTLDEAATVKIVVSSTGNSNTSAVGILDSQGSVVANTDNISTVTGASSAKVTLTYSLEAGTYQVVSPADSSNNRGARLYSIEVVEGNTLDVTTIAANGLADKDVLPAGTSFIGGSPIGAVLNNSKWEDYPHLVFSVPEEGYTLEERNVLSAYDVLFAICDVNAVYQDIVLPVSINNCEISWVSSDPSVFKVGTDVTSSLSTFRSVVGSVLRSRDGDKQVTLTATITSGTATMSKEFTLNIIEDEPAIGEIINYQSRYIVDLYNDFTEPTVSVTNAASKSGRLLEEGEDKDYTLTKSYEYAKDKNSKYYQVSKVYTSRPGVYKVTYAIQSNIDKNDTKTINYYVYVASPTAQVDFTNGYVINLTPNGYKVSGELSNVTGYVYTYTSSNETEEVATVIANGEEFSITSDYINVEASASHTESYYIHVVVTNKANTFQSKVYSEQVTYNTIDDEEEFYAMVNSAVSETTIYELTKDLTFTSWTVTTHTNQFKGLFNGNGHTISGITIADGTNNSNVNVFYKVTGGTIMNVNFENMSIEGGTSSKGVGIVGSMNGGNLYNINITNIDLKGNEAIGGLVGQVTGGENFISEVSLVNSETNTMTSSKRYLGGIVGLFQRDTGLTTCALTITNCYVNASIGEKDTNIQYLGGILGRGKNDIDGDYLLIDRCIFSGQVASTNNYLGGIIGGNDNGLGTVIVSNCASDIVIIHKNTRYEYTDPIYDPETDSYIYTVGHKDASPITGRYTISTGNGSYTFTNNYGSFVDNYPIVSSQYINFENLFVQENFFASNLKLDLVNIWIWDSATNTISLR